MVKTRAPGGRDVPAAGVSSGYAHPDLYYWRFWKCRRFNVPSKAKGAMSK